MKITIKQLHEYFKENKIDDKKTIKYVSDGFEVINKLNLWKWIKYHYYLEGFMFSNDKNIKLIVDNLKYKKEHSGMTIGLTLRYLQSLSNKYISDDINYCIICLNTEVTNKYIKTTCDHYFHEKCLRKYNNINNICPICRNHFK